MKENTKYTDTSLCPTQEALEHYVFSEMNNAEQHTIERHLLHCKICDDAVEGLLLLKDEKELLAATKNINKKIEFAIGKNKGNNRTILSIAAGLALLIGLTFYFTTNQHQQLVTNNIEPETNSRIVRQDSNAAEILTEEKDTNPPQDETPITLKPTSIKQLAADFKSEKKAITKTPMVENLANDITFETAAGKNETPVHFDAPVAAMPKQAVDIAEDLSSTKTVTDDSKQEENVDVIAAKSAKKTAEVSVKTKAEAKAKSEADEKSKYESESIAKIATSEKLKIPSQTTSVNQPAMSAATQTESLKEIQVQEAKSRKLDSFMNERTIAQSNYKSGVNYFEKKNFEKALKSFEVVLRYPKTDFYEEAQFQKAKCLIELGKKEEAKTLLQIIINQNGKHMEEAKKIQLTIDN